MPVTQTFFLSHLSSSYERVPTEYTGNNDPATPLLSSTLPKAVDDEANICRKPKSWSHRHKRLLLAVVAVFAVFFVVGVIVQRELDIIEAMSSVQAGASANSINVDESNMVASKGGPPEDSSKAQVASSHSAETFNFDDPTLAARLYVDALFARQSSNLEHATARYSLKTGRPPPRNYDQWFKFAQANSCLIDEYDQIHRDFKPFYQLAEDDPLFFQRMIDIASNMMKQDPKEMATVMIKDGQVYMSEIKSTAYWDTWPITFTQFAPHLPDMTFLINGRDEPRVVFDYREPGARSKALAVTEDIPFDVSPHPTSDFFLNRSGCDILARPEGFTATGNDDSAFFISSAKTQFTVDLYPMLSMTKVSPCFADILFPIEYYYDRSWWSGKFAYPNNIEWENKKSQIYWRGTSSGGQIFGSNYHNFTRFRLLDIARENPDLIDVAMTSFADELCGAECDREGIISEYNITGNGAPREDSYMYKYLLDVDGTTFSGRYLGLLRSGSLVFKATVFEEYFNDWLRPFEHYIPVLPDLSDLTEKLEWAINHDDEARMIQERGREIGQRVMTDAQNDCYFFAVLLEWARLQEISRNATNGRS
ncbi:glycosyl transferase family 90-domain-containing protein [Mycena galericulata]|nr:glycosyl transferase family 90-domain-containing protein [Mycena galericulata]